MRTLSSRIRSSSLPVAIFTAVMIGACSSNGADEGATSITGTYTLETVNGARPPVPVTVNGTTVTLNSESIVLSDDATWREMQSVTAGGVTTISPDSGTYAQSGTTLTFYQWGTTQVVATWLTGTSGTLTGSNLGYTLIFKK